MVRYINTEQEHITPAVSGLETHVQLSDLVSVGDDKRRERLKQGSASPLGTQRDVWCRGIVLGLYAVSVVGLNIYLKYFGLLLLLFFVIKSWAKVHWSGSACCLSLSAPQGSQLVAAATEQSCFIHRTGALWEGKRCDSSEYKPFFPSCRMNMRIAVWTWGDVWWTQLPPSAQGSSRSGLTARGVQAWHGRWWQGRCWI